MGWCIGAWDEPSGICTCSWGVGMDEPCIPLARLGLVGCMGIWECTMGCTTGATGECIHHSQQPLMGLLGVMHGAKQRSIHHPAYDYAE